MTSEADVLKARFRKARALSRAHIDLIAIDAIPTSHTPTDGEGVDWRDCYVTTVLVVVNNKAPTWVQQCVGGKHYTYRPNSNYDEATYENVCRKALAWIHGTLVAMMEVRSGKQLQLDM